MGQTEERLATELRSGEALGNYKSALQERLQASRSGTPVYRVKSESGPDHHKRFLVEVRLKNAAGKRGEALARGTGRTKKLAENKMLRGARSIVYRLSGSLEASVSGGESDAESQAGEQEQTAR